MRKKYCFIIFVLILILNNTSFADNATIIIPYPVTILTCEEYLKSEYTTNAKENNLFEKIHIQGYLSGLNVANSIKKPTKIIPSYDNIARISCDNNNSKKYVFELLIKQFLSYPDKKNDDKNSSTISGIGGSMNCGEFLKAKSIDNRVMKFVLTWSQAYLEALNYVLFSFSKKLPVIQIQGENIVNKCSVPENKDKLLFEILNEIFVNLK